MSLVAYTANREILIPDVEQEPRQEYIYVPLRGYGYMLAVYALNDTCIGWISCTTLGYESVIEWVTKTNWHDQGY